MSEDWDIDSYKTEYENPDHWELKKKFMVVHKDKFSEDELVSLAQVFANIEFLGCRYPDKTMIRVAELAKGVVEEFREERKNSLKRTFVAASDAASAKAKGQYNKNSEGGPSKKFKRSSVDNKTHENMHGLKMNKIDFVSGKSVLQSATITKYPNYGGVKTFYVYPEETEEEELAVVSTSENELENFVLFLTPTESHPITEIERSATLNKAEIRWEFEDAPEISSACKVCKLFLNNILVSKCKGMGKKNSKEKTATEAVLKLRETCFAIKVKSPYISDNIVLNSHLSSVDYDNLEIGDDNIGKKLMRLMGWKGGGLGSRGQGIETPLDIPVKVSRDGLGRSREYWSEEKKMNSFRETVKHYIKNWMDGPTEEDLVFSSEFSLAERKEMHLIARQFALKSRSYGKGENRQIVISKKIKPLEIVEELKRTGKPTKKYELLYPVKKSD